MNPEAELHALLLKLRDVEQRAADASMTPSDAAAAYRLALSFREKNEPMTSKLWTLPLLPCAEPHPAGEQSEAPGASLPRLAARKKRSQP